MIVALVAGVIAVTATTAAAQGQRFPDVPADHYAFGAVEWAAEVGVTLGYPDGTFRPQEPLSKGHAVVFMERYYDEILGADESEDFTRGDMMVLLKAINDGTLRGAGAPDDPASTAPEAAEGQRFPDVAADHYAFGAVEWAAEVGVTLGYPDGTFRPQEPLSKGHAVVFMERYYDEILGADESEDFTRGDMMVLLKAINDGTLRSTGADTGTGAFKAVTAGGSHSCAIRGDGTVACWGYNHDGQADAPSGTFKAVAAGGFHSCAIRSDDALACWGDDRYGQTGAPSGRFRAVAAGELHSCAIRGDDSIACWGANLYGQADAPEGTYKAVAAGGFHSCAIRTDDSIDDSVDDPITCWGNPGAVINTPPDVFKAVAAGGSQLRDPY